MVALLLLGLWQLGGLCLWRDEVASVVFAKGSLGDLLTVIGRDRDAVGLANMATYYLLLHFWLLVGETEARIRLLSVLFGVASVVPVYFIARRLGGWLAAAVAAGIFALIPYVIHYSQEARGYSLAMLIGGALTWLVLIGVERGRAPGGHGWRMGWSRRWGCTSTSSWRWWWPPTGCGCWPPARCRAGAASLPAASPCWWPPRRSR